MTVTIEKKTLESKLTVFLKANSFVIFFLKFVVSIKWSDWQYIKVDKIHPYTND